LNPFDAPSKTSNVVLIVGGKKLHVSKELLTRHSPVFAAMFCNECGEDMGKDEETIDDVVDREFVDLLKVIHPGYSPFTQSSVSHIVKLG
ncbi:hypothetical protein PMAYCL1PPCAC_25476, partial [Pristionchus mayeri]